MAAPADVTFDVLLGGKVTPELLKSFKRLEDLMKQQGATAKTINAVMGRAYHETFDKVAKEGKKAHEEVEHSAKEAFHKMIEHAREAEAKVRESFKKIKESITEGLEPLKKVGEYFGITGLIGGAVGTFIGAHAGEELIKEGLKVHRARSVEQEVLAATLRGRGLGAQAPEWAEDAEKLAAQAHIGHDTAMKMMTRLANKFKSPEEAERMALALIGLGGGTAEGAQGALAAYGKLGPMMMAGRVRPTAIAQLGRGGGLGGALIQELSRQTGIAPADLAKEFAQAKVSRRTGEVTGGALAGAKGVEALNKAILALGSSRGFELIQAHMQGMDGMFYRFSEHWEDFVDKIGEFVEKIISPISEEVNKLLDSIQWDNVFHHMIETGKEWGQLVKAVWDTIANSPILMRIKQMWDEFWKSFTGGVELYGPYVETWNDNLHHELGTHMARHMTEAGRAWVKATSERIEGFIKGIIDAFSWFKDNWQTITAAIWTIIDAFLFLKGIEVATTIANFAKAALGLAAAVGGPGGATFALIGFTAYVGLLTKNMLDYLNTQKGQEQAKAQEQARMHPGATAAEVVALGEHGALPESSPAVKAAAQRAAQYAATTNDKAAESALHRAEADERLREINQKVMTDQIRHHILIEKGAAAVKMFDDAMKTATGNDLVHFAAATADATQALTQFTLSTAGFGAGAGAGFGGAGGFGLGVGGGGGGGVSGAHFTEYGPDVAGDQPGQATYDWNSYHHVGAWPGVTGPLRAGDVALGHGAQAKYHVMPGQMFTDEYGRTWRFADRSGSKDPFNVDVFKGAMGGIFRRPTRALIGEAGPEAVVPLAGAGGALAGVGGVTININVAGSANDPEAIADAVHRVIREHDRRRAVV